MTLDRTFAAEIKKQANGDGSREAKFAFYKKAREQAGAANMALQEICFIFFKEDQ